MSINQENQSGSWANGKNEETRRNRSFGHGRSPATKMVAGTPVMEAADKGINVVVLSCFETMQDLILKINKKTNNK